MGLTTKDYQTFEETKRVGSCDCENSYEKMFCSCYDYEVIQYTAEQALGMGHWACDITCDIEDPRKWIAPPCELRCELTCDVKVDWAYYSPRSRGWEYPEAEGFDYTGLDTYQGSPLCPLTCDPWLNPYTVHSKLDPLRLQELVEYYQNLSVAVQQTTGCPSGNHGHKKTWIKAIHKLIACSHVIC